MNQRVYNFCAGPCTLPESVLKEVQDELLNYRNHGCSVIEMSHRGAAFDEIHHQALQLARSLLHTPDDFELLFLPGGASMQFSMTALNLLRPGLKAAFIRSGHWSIKAYEEAKRIGDAYYAWQNEDKQRGIRLPEDKEIQLQENTRYLHVTANETIEGLEYEPLPQSDIPLVVDASSNFFTRSIPWDRIDILYGGAQKNLAPAGLALVYLRRSILQDIPPLAKFLDYITHVNGKSMYNTPPTFQIYVLAKVLKWIEAQGGVDYFDQLADKKSEKIYQVIEQHPDFYKNSILPAYRSRMNITFQLPDESLNDRFVKEAEEQQMVSLKGHRVIGGIRVSLYNAMPMEGVEKLAEFMQDFIKKNG